MKKPEGTVGTLQGFSVGYVEGLVTIEALLNEDRLLFTVGQARMLGEVARGTVLGRLLGEAVEKARWAVGHHRDGNQLERSG